MTTIDQQNKCEQRPRRCLGNRVTRSAARPAEKREPKRCRLPLAVNVEAARLTVKRNGNGSRCARRTSE